MRARCCTAWCCVALRFAMMLFVPLFCVVHAEVHSTANPSDTPALSPPLHLVYNWFGLNFTLLFHNLPRYFCGRTTCSLPQSAEPCSRQRDRWWEQQCSWSWDGKSYTRVAVKIRVPSLAFCAHSHGDTGSTTMETHGLRPHNVH